jgi:hypothetical protein
VALFDFFSLENYVNVQYLQTVIAEKSKMFEQKLIFVGILKVNNEKAGSGSESGSGSISQRHGSADQDPDPLQNVMDPEHCFLHRFLHAIVRYLTTSSYRYVKCDDMAKKAMEAVESGELKIIPDSHK